MLKSISLGRLLGEVGEGDLHDFPVGDDWKDRW